MIVPYVVERTASGGERALDVYSRLLADRIVYLGAPIDDDVANVIVAQLLHLESAEPGNPIDLYVNSPGGSPSAMLAVYDAMQFVRSPVYTTCVGQASGAWIGIRWTYWWRSADTLCTARAVRRYSNRLPSCRDRPSVPSTSASASNQPSPATYDTASSRRQDSRSASIGAHRQPTSASPIAGAVPGPTSGCQ